MDQWVYVALCRRCWHVVAASMDKEDVIEMLAPDRIIVMVEAERGVGIGNCRCSHV